MTHVYEAKLGRLARRDRRPLTVEEQEQRLRRERERERRRIRAPAAARGYGAEHRLLRKRLQALVATGRSSVLAAACRSTLTSRGTSGTTTSTGRSTRARSIGPVIALQRLAAGGARRASGRAVLAATPSVLEV